MKYSKIIIMAGLLPFAVMPAQARINQNNGVISEDPPEMARQSQVASLQSTTAYWTAARMSNAKPMPTPTSIVSEASLLFPPVSQESQSGAEQAEPGFTVGCRPNAKNCNNTPRKLPTRSSATSAQAYGDLLKPMLSTKPTNPKDGPYGPFQRWREADPITSYPKSTVGKLFFTLGGQNFVCSASVINRSTLITAGHCNSDGKGNFASNRLFCPSYIDGQHPTIGCWSVVTSSISTRWHTLGDADYDYSCLVTATTGTKIANKVGNVTGWLGRAWNFEAGQAERTFGYPAASPFTGGTLQTTASTEWYTHDFVSGGQVSKIIGSDLTGGASGGPWILGWTGGFSEAADTDGSNATDPGGNWVNGVNSHKRCLVNCNTPPTTTSGLFWQEMTSPPFRNTTTEDGESEDVIALCNSNANNN